MDGPGADNSTFKPILATAGHALAPRAPSRLRLAAELDTYMERVQVLTQKFVDPNYKYSWDVVYTNSYTLDDITLKNVP